MVTFSSTKITSGCSLRTQCDKHRAQDNWYHATLLPHVAGILKHRCMSEIRHHRPQQRLGLHVPPRYDLLHNTKLQHARLTTRASCACNRFGTSVPLAKQQKHVSVEIEALLQSCDAQHNQNTTEMCHSTFDGRQRWDLEGQMHFRDLASQTTANDMPRCSFSVHFHSRQKSERLENYNTARIPEIRSARKVCC